MKLFVRPGRFPKSPRPSMSSLPATRIPSQEPIGKASRPVCICIGIRRGTSRP